MKRHPLIAVDARTIFDAPRRGIGKTLVELYRHLAAMKPDWRFVFFHQLKETDNPFAELTNITSRRIDIPGDRFDLWQQVRLPIAAKLAGADLLHFPANTASCYPLVPMILTIHDLIPLETSPLNPQAKRWGENVRRAAKNARRIITPSEFSRAKIVQSFGVKADKVIVSPWAPTIHRYKVNDANELGRIRAKYGLPAEKPYVFGFGAADPRKNTLRILLAWKELPAELQNKFMLLLTGIQEQALGEFRRKVQEFGLSQSVILHGFADEQDLPALLSEAKVFCYPSLSEGFGLPILEAFACETAVLSGDVTSLPEVAGDAALLINPKEVSEIKNGLVKLLENDMYRADLVRRGRERLHVFTWANGAARVAKVFEDVLNGRV